MGQRKQFNEIADIELLKKQIAMNLQSEVCKNLQYTNDLVFIIQNFIKMITNNEYQAIDIDTKKIITLNDVRGFYVAGGIGSGKTTLMKALIKTMQDLNISYHTDIEGTRYFFNKNNIYSVTTLNKMYVSDNELPTKYAVIVIDDLRENMIFRNMGNTYSIDLFIQDRYDESHTLTFITSNLPLSEKYLKLDQRSISRLHEMCAYYELRNSDFRKQYD